MKTFGYLLNDENNPPKLWAIYPFPDDEGKVIFYDPIEKGNWGWTTRDGVLEESVQVVALLSTLLLHREKELTQ